LGGTFAAAPDLFELLPLSGTVADELPQALTSDAATIVPINRIVLNLRVTDIESPLYSL
jgi:hypothetical protein